MLALVLVNRNNARKLQNSLVLEGVDIITFPEATLNRQSLAELRLPLGVTTINRIVVPLDLLASNRKFKGEVRIHLVNLPFLALGRPEANAVRPRNWQALEAALIDRGRGTTCTLILPRRYFVTLRYTNNKYEINFPPTSLNTTNKHLHQQRERTLL